jgi:hypothetical protein
MNRNRWTPPGYYVPGERGCAHCGTALIDHRGPEEVR